MDSVILPVVKNKGGDLTDIDNYRAIAVSNAETKILETVILTRFNEVDNCDMWIQEGALYWIVYKCG